MTTAFISYTHADEPLKDLFLQHLAPLRREGLIELWHDRMLNVGDHLDENIQKELASSDLIILLVSAAFLDSEYCFEEEMQRAFARQREGKARVVVVILRPCQWKNVPVGSGLTLSSFLAVPKDGKPVTSWANADEAFDDAAGFIRRLLVTGSRASGGSPAVRSETSGSQTLTPVKSPPTRRSGSLFLPGAKITDRDRDSFVKEAFESAADTFDKGLRQLSDGDPRIETEYERIDSRSFSAIVYAHGNKAGECRIFTGSQFFPNALCLSFDVSSRGSMNEWLTLNEENGELSFKASGMAGYIRRSDRSLNPAAAAEYLWETFFAHVKARLF
ncbi:MAG TPA: toll/interleukin-1 receptor domain-containing protein [Allosphingosinicella sp.]|jgi:hypothetical protein